MAEDIDYDATQVDIERARRMAELLRRQTTTPQGRMVGRFYVASDPLQHLAGLVNEYRAGAKEREADELSRKVREGQSQKFSEVLSEMPQRQVLTRSVTPDMGAGVASTPGAMPMSPDTVRAQATSVLPEERTEVVNPTRQDMLRWAGQLYKLPMARELATKVMSDYTGQPKKVPIGHIGVLDQDTGEMEAFGPGVQIELAKLAQASVDLQLRLQDKNLDRQSREMMAERLRQTQELIARIRSEKDPELVDLNKQLKQAQIDKLAATAEEKAKGKMPTRYQDEQVTPLVKEAAALQRILKEFEATPGIYGGGGILKRGRLAYGQVAGDLADEKTQRLVEMQRMIQRFDDLPQRHEMFGATLSSGEKASWAGATIATGMGEDKVKEFLGIRMKIIQENLPKVINKLKKEGVNTEGMEQYMQDMLSMKASMDKSGSATPPSDVNLSGAKVKKVK